MSIYVLAITPDPIDDADVSRAFTRMAACNPSYQDITWNGVVNFARCERYGLWTSLMQMNDDEIQEDNQLTVVWSADPFDAKKDQAHALYHYHRPTIVRIVDEWAAELGTRRQEGLYFEGDVAWPLQDAKTSLLAEDFAGARRERLQVLTGGK